MKILYLLPPSERKNNHLKNETSSSPWEGEELRWGKKGTEEKLSFNFKKPINIAINASEKDLKCSGKRYEEGIELNKKLCNAASFPFERERIQDRVVLWDNWEMLPAISRYSWVMYNAIDYAWMTSWWGAYFDKNFLILSGMYGILRPQDMIGNYKLPIETKWLKDFWWDKITEVLNESKADYIVDLLPNSYKKVIQWKKLNAKIMRIDFFIASLPNIRERIQDRVMAWVVKKLTHGVKKVKWEFIKNICESWYKSLEDFPWEKVQISENEYHISIIV